MLFKCCLSDDLFWASFLFLLFLLFLLNIVLVLVFCLFVVGLVLAWYSYDVGFVLV